MVSSSPIPMHKLFTITKLTFQRNKIKPGNILIILFGGDIGRVFRYKNEDRLPSGLGKVTILRPDLIDEEYLYQLLHSPRYALTWDRNKAVHSTTIDHSFLDHETIILPQLSKQKEIVHLFQKAERLLKMRRNSNSLLQQALNAVFVSCFGDPVQNPKGFELIALGDIVTINPSKKGISDRNDLLVPYVKMEDLFSEGVSLSEYRKVRDMREGSYSYFANGDVLFPKISPSLENGKGCVIAGLEHDIGFGSSEFVVLRPISNVTHAYWIHRLLSLPSSRRWAAQFLSGSAGRRRISVAFLKSWKVPLPPFELQREFSTVAHSLNAIRLKQTIAHKQLVQLIDLAQNNLFIDLI
ncbi:restriction endonuclease subunit S [Paenibacillus radicis (ex Xue et al. 2023)]|uniref:Restriction endonuclease subunit S n=1 Tax=Paenibacillus radicis (ex Xue et al. 2023) TaxID=2972489 RepID=A0ABT1YJ39_9BACL|nr:restriction endonuclease subunit S [Paenibacillus radicis (ex Xue et al. 2023)]MCR8633197.1 restriction endonuclease subunit S [Paenibacillus radicis (ex Xue et al. 2023)]